MFEAAPLQAGFKFPLNMVWQRFALFGQRTDRRLARAQARQDIAFNRLTSADVVPPW